MGSQQEAQRGTRKRIAMFASVDSFEGFYGGTFALDRETYLRTYRNDFIWEYAEGLRRCGHDVFIYMLSYGPALLREVNPGLYVRFLPLPLWLRVLDTLLWRIRNLRGGVALRERIAYRAYGKALQTFLREDGIEVLYHQEIWTPRFDTIVEHTAIPVIGAEHGAVYAEWMEPAKRRSFPAAAHLISQSLSNLERAQSFGGKVDLMYNGVDTKFFQPPANTELRSRTVLAVGRFVEEQKRFSDLLQAMSALPDFTLTIVGSGADEAKLKKLAADLKLMDRVHFAGFISDRKQLRKLYQECGVFVSTSKWEAVALVLLEAMSCGAPVVATRIPSFEELLEDEVNGLLVPVGAKDALSRAIRTAHEKQTALGDNARQTVVTRYSSEVLYERLSELVEAVS